MTPLGNYKQVNIHITTFKRSNTVTKSTEYKNMMTEPPYNRRQNESSNRFICSICLSSNKQEFKNKFKNKVSSSCPICRQSSVVNHQAETAAFDKKDDIIDKPVKRALTPKQDTKTVQTSQTNVNQDLHLLKEVLTVFQNSKQVINKDRRTPRNSTNDVSVETEAKNRAYRTKLTRSRVFKCSIDNNNSNYNTNKFTIVNSSQPDHVRSTQFAIDLTKQKSSSIPQMRMEELKYSLKEKTRSKDAIDEVNRMFANVRRNRDKSLEDINRPLVRNGPRVLPVVKTSTPENDLKKELSETELEKSTDQIVGKSNDMHCKCCQNSKWQLSGGDSFFEHDCCYRRMLCKDKGDKCVYMICCHPQKHNKLDCGAMVCKHCNEND